MLADLVTGYNIFLIPRARDEGLTAGAREGMLRALVTTGAVVTGAGLVLAITPCSPTERGGRTARA